MDELKVRLQVMADKGGHVRISVEEMKAYYRLSQSFNRLHNEITRQESGPLCAADISPSLRKQFAFLSGGRGKSGSPIIVFPEFPAFDQIPEHEFRSVLAYLTSVPSLAAAALGFTLVIDRQLDKWASVKGALLRILSSFPGNLRIVLVLRPTALFQRTLSDLFFTFHKDEFTMKVPVTMLSSLTELHSYIDRAQLTQELGGTQRYCHQKWISHRTAIEGFTLMVQTTAKKLQSFGSELAETELPGDIQAISILLGAHTKKKDEMKEDLDIALRQSTALLESINEPLLREPSYSMNADELENMTTVQRLMSQLDETEKAFDEFWVKHQAKMKQCLQLLHFKQNFREVRAQLDPLVEHMESSAFSKDGIVPTHVERLLQDLNYHKDQACDVLHQAQTLASEGDRLIEANPYAMDSIQSMCSELRTTCENLTNNMSGRKTHLLKALELHQSLEKVAEWCEGGMCLLASQPLERCQSQGGAESALQEIERYLTMAGHHNWLLDLNAVRRQYDSVLNDEFRERVEKLSQKWVSTREILEKRRVCLKKLAVKHPRPIQSVAPRPEALTKSPLSSPVQLGPAGTNSTFACQKVEVPLQNCSRYASLSEEDENRVVLRRHVMTELLETERVYVEELLCVLQGYAAEMDNPAMMHLIPSALQNKKDVLFGNMPEIYQFHKGTFLKDLEAKSEFPELMGRCFLERMTDLQIYEKYCQNKPRSESLWRQCSDCAFFQECQKKLEHKLGLDSYLLKPVQRITKYQLLLKELLKYSKGCEWVGDLQEALSSILGILKAVNDSMHLIAISGYEGNLSDLGRLLMQGSFNMWTEHKKGHAKVKDLARFKPMQRHLFLHQKALLFCKRREENGEGYEKAPSYSFKHALDNGDEDVNLMNTVGITENAKGDTKKFEIWCSSREEVHIVQAPTAEIKTAWVNEIRNVLTGQLNACREASQQRASDQVFLYPSTNPAPIGPSSLKSMRKEELKTDSPDFYFSPSTKYKDKCREEQCADESIISPTTERNAVAKKRFTLQGFGNLKSQKGSPTSPDFNHEMKRNQTAFGFKDSGPRITLNRTKWLSSSGLLQAKRKGWAKASLSTDAVEKDGYSSDEGPLNSDPENEGDKKLSPGKYTVQAECEKSRLQELSAKRGDLVQAVTGAGDGQWLLRNLDTKEEGWVPGSNLMSMIGVTKSSHSLSSLEGSGSGNLSASSSCSETNVGFSDIKA